VREKLLILKRGIFGYYLIRNPNDTAEYFLQIDGINFVIVLDKNKVIQIKTISPESLHQVRREIETYFSEMNWEIETRLNLNSERYFNLENGVMTIKTDNSVPVVVDELPTFAMDRLKVRLVFEDNCMRLKNQSSGKSITILSYRIALSRIYTHTRLMNVHGRFRIHDIFAYYVEDEPMPLECLKTYMISMNPEIDWLYDTLKQRLIEKDLWRQETIPESLLEEVEETPREDPLEAALLVNVDKYKDLLGSDYEDGGADSDAEDAYVPRRRSLASESSDGEMGEEQEVDEVKEIQNIDNTMNYDKINLELFTQQRKDVYIIDPKPFNRLWDDIIYLIARTITGGLDRLVSGPVTEDDPAFYQRLAREIMRLDIKPREPHPFD